MTRDETSRILAVIDTTYSCFKGLSKAEITDKINTWHWILEDFDYKAINQALKSLLITSKYPPMPAELIAIVNKPQEIALNQSYTEEGEAWALVRKALSNSAYHSVEEFDKLPTLVQKALGSSSILKTMALDEDFNESVESSNFKRQYRRLVEQDKEYQKLPEEYKAIARKEQALIEESM